MVENPSAEIARHLDSIRALRLALMGRLRGCEHDTQRASDLFLVTKQLLEEIASWQDNDVTRYQVECTPIA